MTETATGEFHTVGRGDAVADGAVVPFYLENVKRRISVARVGEHLYGFDDICTCADEGCPLSSGLLDGTTVMCQCHGSEWDLTTGAVTKGPATQALHTYEVQVADGALQVRI